MDAATSVFAGLVCATVAAACAEPIQGGLINYTEGAPVASSMAASAVAAQGAAGAPSMQAVMTATTAHPTPPAAAAVPLPAAIPSTPAMPAAPSTAGNVSTATSTTAQTGSAAAANAASTPQSTFNAGSGTLLPDGKTVEYHIPDGTGGNDWNPTDNPIRVRRGMILRLIDDDKSTRAGGHWLHTNGQPCSHGRKAIGTGFDCNIGANAPIGPITGVFEHNVSNGIGQLHIEVVADAN